MATERRLRKEKQNNLPILHIYEKFVNNASSRNGKANNRGMEMVSLSIASRRRRRYCDIEYTDDMRTELDVQTSTHPLDMRSILVEPSSPLTPLTLRQPKVESPPQQQLLQPKQPRIPVATRKSPRHYHSNKTTSASQRELLQKLTTKNNEPQNNSKLTMYERSKIRLKEREKKLEKVRCEMMEECTFKPKISSRPRHLQKTLTKTKGDSIVFISRAGTDQGKMMTTTQKTTTPKVLALSNNDIRTTPSGSTAATTPTTTPNNVSTTRQYWQGLQRKQQQQQQQEAQPRRRILAAPSRDESCATKSSRFEELYQDGLRRAKQRPPTEKMEQELRRKRYEDEQLLECTFKPKLYWGNRVPTNRRKPLFSASSVTSSRLSQSRRGHQSLSPHGQRSNTAKKPGHLKAVQPTKNINPSVDDSPIRTKHSHSDFCSASLIQPPPRREKTPPPLPREITTTKTPYTSAGIVALSPERNTANDKNDWKANLYTAISPLRDPVLGLEIDHELEHSPMAPRIIFCGTTVGGESSAAETRHTEYGSI